jgi:hypothetical protein
MAMVTVSWSTSFLMPPVARKSGLVKPAADVPSKEQVSSVRHKKKLLMGAEQFNSKSAKGIHYTGEWPFGGSIRSDACSRFTPRIFTT